MRVSYTKKIAYMGLLFTVAIIFSYLESFIPVLPGLPPGIKPGLSNIITMFCFFYIGIPSTLVVVVLKSIFSFLIRGLTAGFLSISGGLSALLAMMLLTRLGGGRFSVGIISAAAGVFHNVGQLIAVWIILENPIVFYYIPILIFSGIIMGLITGIIFRSIAPYLKGLGG